MGKVKRTWLTRRNKTRQYLYPKQALYTSWIVCICVSPVRPLQQAVSVKHGAGSKHGPDTAERASPCVFTEIKITLEDTASPRQRWQTYELPTDVQAAVATVTNRCSGRKQEMHQCCTVGKCPMAYFLTCRLRLFRLHNLLPSFNENVHTHSWHTHYWLSGAVLHKAEYNLTELILII